MSAIKENKDKIKKIKEHLYLPSHKIAGIVNMSIDNFYRFCNRHGIKLSQNKNILKLIKNNPKLSAGLLSKKVMRSKAYLAKLLNDHNVVDSRFRKTDSTIIRNNPVKGISNKIRQEKSQEKFNAPNKKSNNKNSKPNIDVRKITYEKLSHEKLTEILRSADSFENKIVKDISELGIGEALRIKKNNWSIHNRPYYYFGKMLIGTQMKVRVREVDGDIFIIRIR